MQKSNDDDIFKGLGVEVFLPDDDSFLLIKETLERIGIPSYKNNEKTLFQSCHILHKRGRYSIIHFLELFILDGKNSTITDDDRRRRDLVALMLDEWNLCEIDPVQKKRILQEDLDDVKLKVLKHEDREFWTIKSKYNVGGKKKKS